MANPTEEQTAQIQKLYKSYFKKLALMSILYTMWIIFSVSAVTILNIVYVHSTEFQTMVSFGTGLIGFLGLHGSVKEQHDILVAERNKILPPQ